MPKKTFPILVGGLMFIAGAAAASPPLVVHEWGTFTSFQDEQGRTISRINVDDEPVPFFVHRKGPLPVLQTTSLPALWSKGKGAPSCYPGVTMRLETPVLYFYPPAGWQSAPFDVRATFMGGWLTEFYPAAISEGESNALLDGSARGSLEWRQVQLDPAQFYRLRNTDSHVWTAPRKVKATIVSTKDAEEAEKFLFYRGVGNLDAPLVVRQEKGMVRVALRDGGKLGELPRLWLFEVQPDGGVQLATLDGAGRTLEAPALTAAAPGEKSALVELRRQLKQALVAQGLYDDEAEAMLETWKLSYFDSPGLRLFFLLPQAWTDARLPLSISTPAKITRVMVGRIELVSPRQVATLKKIYALKDDAFPAKPLYIEKPAALGAWRTGELTLAGLYRAVDRPVPKSLQLYESLGRFRDALVAHEMEQASDAAQRGRLMRMLYNYGACDGDVRVREPVQTTQR